MSTAMNIGWWEFAVIIACGLVGFLIMSAILESRPVKERAQRVGEDDAHAEERENANRSGADESRD